MDLRPRPLTAARMSGSRNGFADVAKNARPSQRVASWWLVGGCLEQKLTTFSRDPLPYQVAVDMRGVPPQLFDLLLAEGDGCETAEDWCTRELPAIAEWLVQSSGGAQPGGRQVPTEVQPWARGEDPPQLGSLVALGQSSMLPGAEFYLLTGKTASH